jgi:hypothetical protein
LDKGDGREFRGGYGLEKLGEEKPTQYVDGCGGEGGREGLIFPEVLTCVTGWVVLPFTRSGNSI